MEVGRLEGPSGATDADGGGGVASCACDVVDFGESMLMAVGEAG